METNATHKPDESCCCESCLDFFIAEWEAMQPMADKPDQAIAAPPTRPLDDDDLRLTDGVAHYGHGQR